MTTDASTGALLQEAVDAAARRLQVDASTLARGIHAVGLHHIIWELKYARAVARRADRERIEEILSLMGVE